MQLLHEILRAIGNHLFVVMIPLTFLGMIGFENAYLGVWCGLVVIPFVFYALRASVHTSFLFAVLHFAVVAVCGLLPIGNMVVRIGVVVIAFAYMIASLYLRMHSEEPKDGAIHAIVPFVVGMVLRFAQGKYGNALWTEYYVWLVVVFYALYVVGFYVERYLFFVVMNGKTAEKVPEKEIFASGISYVLCFVFGSVICMLLGGNITVFNRLLAALKNLAAFMLSNLHFEYEPQMQAVSEGLGGIDPEMLAAGTTQEPWLIWKILEVAMYIMLAFGAIALAFALLFGLVRMILYGLKKGKRTKEIMMAGEEDVRERLTVQKTVRKQGALFQRGSYKQRIRRTYEKTVSKERKRLIGEGELALLRKFTARECCGMLDREGLRKAYEKARYSDRECTREDLQQMKN